MSSRKEKDKSKYLYYDYHNGHIAREERGNSKCAANRFEFYIDGEWINDYGLSLSLSDAVHDFGGYSIFDYDEISEEEAMRRIAESDLH